MTDPDHERPTDHTDRHVHAADRRPDPGEPTPEELLRQGKDPAWPIPGLATDDAGASSPASDADAPAPG